MLLHNFVQFSAHLLGSASSWAHSPKLAASNVSSIKVLAKTRRLLSKLLHPNSISLDVGIALRRSINSTSVLLLLHQCHQIRINKHFSQDELECCMDSVPEGKSPWSYLPKPARAVSHTSKISSYCTEESAGSASAGKAPKANLLPPWIYLQCK